MSMYSWHCCAAVLHAAPSCPQNSHTQPASLHMRTHVHVCMQDFRGYSRTGKPKVLVMSYPCFRGHKAEVYRLGIDVLMCDEVCLFGEDGQGSHSTAGQRAGHGCWAPVFVSVHARLCECMHVHVCLCVRVRGRVESWFAIALLLRICAAGTLSEKWRGTDHPGSGGPGKRAAPPANVR